MKRMISGLLVLVTVAGLFTGCGRKELMEAPAYPLDKAVVEEQLAAQKLDWTVEEVSAEAADETRFTLLDAEGKRVAVMVSKGEGESRYLKVSFMSSLREEDKGASVLATEDWIGIIAASTVLYGGFTDQYEPYKAFTKGGKDKKSGKTRVYIREDMTDDADKIYEEMIKWTNEYDGISCIYKMGQPEKLDQGLDKPKQELISVTYYNDVKYAEEPAEQK